MRDGSINVELMERVNVLLSPFFDVFIDLIHNDSEKKQERVINELKRSQYVVVLNTPSVDQSLWVKIEIEKATEQNIPILYVDLTGPICGAEISDYIAHSVIQQVQKD